jgi:hypothetical protein
MTNQFKEEPTMRIGEVNKDNYAQFLKLFGGKSSPGLDALLGKDKNGAPKPERTKAEIDAMLIREGVVLEGMIGTEGSSRKIIDVSDDIRKQILDLSEREFLDNYGMTDGEELSAIIRGHIKSLPPSVRADTAWTLDQIFLEEAYRLHDIAEKAIPGWQSGQAFDRSKMQDLINGNAIDIKV